MTKIVVVDDNHDICLLLENILISEGYLVTSCVNPFLAEEIIRKEKPSLLITDMLMSGVDGRTLITNLKKQTAYKDLKTVLISAHPQAEKFSREILADGFMAKPFEMEEFIKKIKEILAL